MLWRHPAHAGRAVRLGYCQNLHPADDLDELLRGLEQITLPLRERVAAQRARGDGPSTSRFGVGLWLPHALALELAQPEGAAQLGRLRDFLAHHALDAFTFNAFPAAAFHGERVKQLVFQPSWAERARLDFTLAVARVASALGRDSLAATQHLSISTHPGAFGAALEDPAAHAACLRHLALAVDGLARLEEEHGVRIVLALEAEPRASSGDGVALARFLAQAASTLHDVLRRECARSRTQAEELVARHLGVCLDLCHAAVEFEHDPLAHARAAGVLGKVQHSNALALVAPAAHPTAVAALLALDEPRYLHQTTGRRNDGLLRVDDLSDLRRELARADSPWLECDEWRTHFHVPVDRQTWDGTPGLGTTRAEIDRALTRLLSDPLSWTTPELHVEIETYTWSLLPELRDAGDARTQLVEGLAREYAHTQSLLRSAGWVRA